MLDREPKSRRVVLGGLLAIPSAAAMAACTPFTSSQDNGHLGKEYPEVLKSFPALAGSRVYDYDQIDLNYGHISWFNFTQNGRLLTDKIKGLYDFLIGMGQRQDLRYGTPVAPVTFWNYDANVHHLFLIPQDGPVPLWHPQGQPKPPADTYFFDDGIFSSYVRAATKPQGSFYRSANEMTNSLMVVEAGQSIFKPIFQGAATNSTLYELYREAFNNCLGITHALKRRGVASYNAYLAELATVRLPSPRNPSQILPNYALFQRDFEALPAELLVETK